MRFQSFNHRAKKAPTLYIKIAHVDITRSLVNVLREDFDYDEEEKWMDYIVVEGELLHILPLLRICYNTDILKRYSPFGDEYPILSYHRMKIRT